MEPNTQLIDVNQEFELICIRMPAYNLSWLRRKRNGLQEKLGDLQTQYEKLLKAQGEEDSDDDGLGEFFAEHVDEQLNKEEISEVLDKKKETLSALKAIHGYYLKLGGSCSNILDFDDHESEDEEDVQVKTGSYDAYITKDGIDLRTLSELDFIKVVREQVDRGEVELDPRLAPRIFDTSTIGIHGGSTMEVLDTDGLETQEGGLKRKWNHRDD